MEPASDSVSHLLHSKVPRSFFNEPKVVQRFDRGEVAFLLKNLPLT